MTGTLSVAAWTMIEDEGMATSIELLLLTIVDRLRVSAGPDEQLEMDVFTALGIERIVPCNVTSSVDATEILRKRIFPGSSIAADVGDDDLTMVDLVCGDLSASVEAPTEPRARIAAMILALVNHRDPPGKSV
jgi:hypothetical protein